MLQTPPAGSSECSNARDGLFWRHWGLLHWVVGLHWIVEESHSYFRVCALKNAFKGLELSPVAVSNRDRRRATDDSDGKEQERAQVWRAAATKFPFEEG